MFSPKKLTAEQIAAVRFHPTGNSIRASRTQRTSAGNVKEDNRLLGRFILMFEAAFRSP